ncbi:MAG: beta-lactamase family protein [Cellvibrionaceae bacterium]|nr:beta-lactamase family protein [Cellvibrionaceae bacterium]
MNLYRALKNQISTLLLTAISFSSLAQENLETRTVNELEALRSQYKLPSLSVAIGHGNEVVFSRALGFADIDTKKKADINTQYSVGSLAKPMTGIALARLTDSNSINIQSTVSEYVASPSYTNLFTVKELAAHIAGIPHDTPERDIAEFVDVKDHASPFDAFYVFDSHPLLHKPGYEYKYSSNGYILLSAVIERAANSNYVDFLRTSIWKTFKMASTELDTSFAGKGNEASYYSNLATDGTYERATVKRDRSFLFGGGGFISTPSDLVKMSQATYDESYLSPSARNMLYKPVRLRSGEPNPEKYSLGWRVGKIRLFNEEQPWTALHHGGVTDNASTSYLLVIPECRASIAFSTNYVPEKFWRMRGKMADILKSYVNRNDCVRFNKSN